MMRSVPFDWLYEALLGAGYNRAVIAAAIAEYAAQEGPPHRTAEQWIRGVRQILSAPADYTEAEITEHWLRQRHHKAVTVARQWEDNAEGWRMYAEHLEEQLEEAIAGQQRVIDSLLEYLADLPLPGENNF